MKTPLTLLALILGLTANATTVAPYAGVIQLSSSNALYKGLDSIIDYHNGVAYGFEISQPVSKSFHLGINYDYASADVKKMTVMGFDKDVSGDRFEAHTVMGFVQKDLGKYKGLTPYVGAGFGVTYANDIAEAHEVRIGVNRTIKDYLTVGLEFCNRGGSTIEDGNLRVEYPATKFFGVKLDWRF